MKYLITTLSLLFMFGCSSPSEPQLSFKAAALTAPLRTYVVSPSGNDSTCAPDSSNKCATLQYVANQVRPGDLVLVEPGTYTGFYLNRSGTQENRITFRAQRDVTINQRNFRTPDGINLEGASYITVDGFTVVGTPRAGIRAVFCEEVHMVNNTADRNGEWGIHTGWCNDLFIDHNVTTNSVEEHGIYVANSGDRPTITNNTIYGNSRNGIHMNGDIETCDGSIPNCDGIISGAVVANNLIYNNGTDGGSSINCDGVQDSLFMNNLIYDAHATGLSLYRINSGGPSVRNRVINNTIVVAADGRWSILMLYGSRDNTIQNNILLNRSSWKGSLSISPDSLPGLVSRRNVMTPVVTLDDGDSTMSLSTWQSTYNQDRDSFAGTVANTLRSDYTLLPSSNAVDNGEYVCSDSDRVGTSRPQGTNADIGSEEIVR